MRVVNGSEKKNYDKTTPCANVKTLQRQFVRLSPKKWRTSQKMRVMVGHVGRNTISWLNLQMQGRGEAAHYKHLRNQNNKKTTKL